MAEFHADLARRFFDEFWNKRQTSSLERFAHAEAVSHRGTGHIVGREEFLENVHRPVITAIPDLHIAIEDIIADERRAVVRWRTTGTHPAKGPGAPASRHAIEFQGITWLNFRDGKIIESWDCWDEEGLMRKLSPAP